MPVWLALIDVVVRIAGPWASNPHHNINQREPEEKPAHLLLWQCIHERFSVLG